MFRIALIYFFVFSYDHGEETVGKELLAIMFCLCWIKLIKYLQAFEPLRYLIKMIFDCFWEIRTFI